MWLLLIPCALVTLGALLLLGPPLGGLLLPHASHLGFWQTDELRPEPTEQARYLILAAAPLLLAAATTATVRRTLWPARLGPTATRAIISLAQVLTVAFLVACWAGQYKPSPGIIYFTPATLAVAGLIAAALVLVISNRRLSTLGAWLLRESLSRRIGALALAIGMTGVWLLHAINTDTSIGTANAITRYHIAFPLDEAFAVVNGLTPLVDFSAQYGSLWPFLSAISLNLFGKTLLVFSITMCALTGIALLAIFGVLRRATSSSFAALLLFLPFVATSFFRVIGSEGPSLHTFGSYFAMFPLRYAGPYLLAWLTARHIGRGTAARTWPLFLAAGLVVLNNTEFGLAGLLAVIAALVWTMPELRVRPLLQLTAHAAAGLAAALALVSVLTLWRAGSLPHLGRLSEFARVYLVGGFGLIPMPRVLGFHLIVYVTYVAAIGSATAQRLRQDDNRVLLGMLAWSGVFGLGAAMYYVGRSSDDTLPSVFSAWALAIALLTVVAVQRTATKRLRLPSLALLAVFYGMGTIVCSLAQTPNPSTQLDRIRQAPRAESPWPLYVPTDEPDARAFVATLADGRDRFVYRHGAPVAIFATIGHRIADAYGVRDVVPYTGIESIQTRRQFEESLDILRRAGGNTVLIPSNTRASAVLARRGFEYVSAEGLRRWHGKDADVTYVGELSKWVDMRHLHPRAPAGGSTRSARR